MLTPQEVEERVFPKAKKGGYDMTDVDSFLDQLTADYTELFKENAVLKRKMKVLADKITEYQETEGAMRATLLAAQKMAKQITDDAEARRDQMLQETEQIAAARAEELAAEVAAEENRLREAKSSVAAMTASIRELLAREEAFLAQLPDYEEEAAAAEETPDAAADVAAEIGASISRIMDEEPAMEAVEGETPTEVEPENEAPVEAETEAEAEPEAEWTSSLEFNFDEVPENAEPLAYDEPEEAAAPAPARTASYDEVDDAPTRRLDLSELRFGRNYEIK